MEELNKDLEHSEDLSRRRRRRLPCSPASGLRAQTPPFLRRPWRTHAPPDHASVFRLRAVYKLVHGNKEARDAAEQQLQEYKQKYEREIALSESKKVGLNSFRAVLARNFRRQTASG